MTDGYRIKIEYYEELTENLVKYAGKVDGQLVAEVSIPRDLVVSDDTRPVIATYTIFRHLLQKARDSGAEINLE